MKKILFSLIATIATLNLSAQTNENSFISQIGDVKVCLLSEGQQQGNIKILLDTPKEITDRYAPEGVFPNATNAYLLQNADGYVLVDAGYGRELFNNLNSLNVDPKEIKVIFLTHMHGDHVGGLLKDNEIVFPNAKIFVSQKEHDYWFSRDDSPAKKVIEKYKDQIVIFNPLSIAEVKIGSCSLIPIEAYGHTPGHICLLVNSGNENLLIWGDLTHAMAVQMPHPEIAVSYDVNPADAIKSRLAILEFVSKNNIPIAGMHIAFPGMGTIKKASEGYEFTPYKN